MMAGEGEERHGAAAAAMAGPGRDRSSFAVTCSLLSQYLKEKKGGRLHGLAGLGMETPPAGAAGGFGPPTTMNLLSALDVPAEPKDAAAAAAASDSVELSFSPQEEASTEPLAVVAPTTALQNGENQREEAQQLTIFYGGKVVVFDNFPATKVKDLLQMVNGGHAVDKAGSNVAAAAQNLPKPSHNLSDMPIARRNSLHRFLEKRKGRITAKSPYKADTSVQVSKKQATGEKHWLELGREMTVKQEM